MCQTDSFQLEVKNALKTCKMSTRINKAQFMHLPQFHTSRTFVSNLVRKIKQLAGLRRKVLATEQ